MRYTLYGEAEGVGAECEHSLWASIRDQRVMDASLSARRAGVKPGMSTASAAALVPGLIFCPQAEAATSAVERLWRTLWNVSPWLETVGTDSFYLQLPGVSPPWTELRHLLKRLDTVLGPEQRVRIGFAENPYLAKALVAWSRFEKIPEARYWRCGRQQCLFTPKVSPPARRHAATTQGLKGQTTEDGLADDLSWFGKMPILALWVFPQTVRNTLGKLGIHRVQDLSAVHPQTLRRHFGKDALLWEKWLSPEQSTRITINYPPLQYHAIWHADAGDSTPLSSLSGLTDPLIQEISARLGRTGLGSLRVSLHWETDTDRGTYTRVAKRPAHSSEQIMAVIAPAFQQTLAGQQLTHVELRAEELRPLMSKQTSFDVWDERSARGDTESITRLVSQVNLKFPFALKQGVHPGFRELRLQAVMDAGS